MDRGSHRYYIATDQLGTPRVITDSSGNVVKTVEYNGFGQVPSDSNTDFDMPIGFVGGLADPASGLVRFGLRDYDPMAGRWTARDPILFDGGQANLYVYVGNNPVGFRDPFGLWCVGASAYVGLGAGAELCCSNGRCSVCGEAGFGAGGSISVGSGDTKKTGNNVIADAEAGCGPLKIGANCAYNYKCGVKCGASASAGPYKIDSSGDIQASASDFETGCKAEAKLAAQTCFEF